MTRTDRDKISAIVLAAGCSRRMGRAKQLLDWNGRTMIEDVVDRVRAVVEHVIVVTGHEAEATSAALADRDVTIVHNPDFADGEMLSSVKVGLAGLPPKCEAFFLVLGDQPGISSETFAALIEAWLTVGGRIVVPRVGGKRGHPILLSTQGIAEILKLPGEATVKTYTSRYENDRIEVDVDDPAILADVDTPADYLRRLRSIDSQTGSATCPSETGKAFAAPAV